MDSTDSNKWRKITLAPQYCFRLDRQYIGLSNEVWYVCSIWPVQNIYLVSIAKCTLNKQLTAQCWHRHCCIISRTQTAMTRAQRVGCLSTEVVHNVHPETPHRHDTAIGNYSERIRIIRVQLWYVGRRAVRILAIDDMISSQSTTHAGLTTAEAAVMMMTMMMYCHCRWNHLHPVERASHVRHHHHQ